MNPMHPRFTIWKAALRKDCELGGKPVAFDAMGLCSSVVLGVRAS